MNKNPGTDRPDDASTNEHKADNAALDEHPAVILELCAGGIDDVLLATEMGVDRIELNCDSHRRPVLSRPLAERSAVRLWPWCALVKAALPIRVTNFF